MRDLKATKEFKVSMDQRVHRDIKVILVWEHKAHKVHKANRVTKGQLEIKELKVTLDIKDLLDGEPKGTKVSKEIPVPTETT